MEQYTNNTPEGSKDFTREDLFKKGAEAASKEVERLHGELEKANENPNEEEHQAAIDKLLPEYEAAVKNERELDDTWMDMMRRY